MKRGEIYFADLDPVIGSEQGGMRPVLIIQNDLGNRFSPTVIVLPLTSRINKTPLPTHVPLLPPQGGVRRWKKRWPPPWAWRTGMRSRSKKTHLKKGRR